MNAVSLIKKKNKERKFYAFSAKPYKLENQAWNVFDTDA